MIDFYGLFSVDAAYVFTGMAAVTLISLIIAIISICKTSSMKKKYKEFMGGSDGTSIEELIKGNLEDVNQIKKLSIENENNIKDIEEEYLENYKDSSDEENNVVFVEDNIDDIDIIKECIDNRLIYQQYPNNNVVFVGYDKTQVPRYACIRATNSSRFMQDAYGSHKAFSFKLDSMNNSNEVHLFESAIDLLSYATLLKMNNKEWYNCNLLSLAGVYQPAKKIDDSKLPLALNYYLNQHQNIKKIYLHLDNDSAGRLATMALKTILPKQYEVIDDPPKIGKDFNDFLCSEKGINYKKNYERER